MEKSGKLSALRRAGVSGTERGDTMDQNILYENVIQLKAVIAVI